MNIVFCKKPKNAHTDQTTWAEQVKVHEENGKIFLDYHFFRTSPFCKDGYKHEMNAHLNKMGWNTGILGITYKEKVRPEEIIYCLAYKEAYENVYYQKVSDHLKDIPLKIKEFMDLVDQETLKTKQRYKKIQPKISSTQDIIEFLKKVGFEFLESS